MDGTNKIKIAGQPGVKLPAVFCIRMSRSSGIFLIEGLLHECAIFTDSLRIRSLNPEDEGRSEVVQIRI